MPKRMLDERSDAVASPTPEQQLALEVRPAPTAVSRETLARPLMTSSEPLVRSKEDGSPPAAGREPTPGPLWKDGRAPTGQDGPAFRKASTLGIGPRLALRPQPDRPPPTLTARVPSGDRRTIDDPGATRGPLLRPTARAPAWFVALVRDHLARGGSLWDLALGARDPDRRRAFLSQARLGSGFVKPDEDCGCRKTRDRLLVASPEAMRGWKLQK
jgi:hypothetical protein